MIYELKSKKTGKTSVIDQEIYDLLVKDGSIRKYNIIKTHKPVKPVKPDEIIEKSKINKPVKND